MLFKNWLLTEEIFPQNKSATVFHRTFKELVDSIMTTNFKSGAGMGCMYGCGLYTTFALESQFTDYMQSTYGDYVIKFKVTDLQNYLICPFMVATSILGQNPQQYLLTSQFKKFGIYDDVARAYSPEQLQTIDDRMNDQYTSDFAKNLVRAVPSIQTKTKGILYRGAKDGYCLVKYPPVEDGTITMLAYADAPVYDKNALPNLKNGVGWVTSNSKAAVKSIYKSPRDKAQNYLDDSSFAKFLTKIGSASPAEAKSMLDNTNFNKVQVYALIQNAKNPFAMAKMLGPERLRLLDWNTVKAILLRSNKPYTFMQLVDPSVFSGLDSNLYKSLIFYMRNRASSGKIDQKEYENIYLHVLPYLAKTTNKRDLFFVINESGLSAITPPEYFDGLSEELNSLTNNDLYNYLNHTGWPNYIADKLDDKTLAKVAQTVSFADYWLYGNISSKVYWMTKLLPYMHEGQIGRTLAGNSDDQQFIDTFKNYLNNPSVAREIIEQVLKYNQGYDLISQINDQALMAAINKLTFNEYEPKRLDAFLNAIQSPEVKELLRNKIQSSQMQKDVPQQPQPQPQGFMSKLKGMFGRR